MTENEIIQRVLVVFKNALTYLVIIQSGLTWLLASGALDEYPQAVSIGLSVLSGLGVIIFFIRRVTPVEQEDRGLLSTNGAKS